MVIFQWGGGQLLVSFTYLEKLTFVKGSFEICFLSDFELSYSYLYSDHHFFYPGSLASEFSSNHLHNFSWHRGDSTLENEVKTTKL